MELRTTVHRVRHGGEEYRVVKAVPRSGRAVLFRKEWSLDMFVDLEGARSVAAAWGLAARSRRSLVYVPLRAEREGPGGLPGWFHSPVVDLVLVQGGLGFPVSRWKAVRGRLGAGHSQVMEIPETDFSGETEPEDWRRDELRFGFASETLFLTGSAEAFRWTGARVHSLVRDGPARVLAGTPWSPYDSVMLHHAGDLTAKGPVKGPGVLNIEYAHGWRAR
ncbi:hypothetical protein [Kitasatospora purpeofusca]|uniref:hypothetical protein n=1 Tax=Kitasatospora purpeofusca TaxID=67352 RepID=UPI0038203198